MLDPLPGPPPWLKDLVKPWAIYFKVPTLFDHIHELLFAFTFYQFVHFVLSPWLSPKLFPRSYRNFNRRTKINWDTHVVSFIQSTVINVMSLWVMWSDKERASMNAGERIYGYTGTSGLLGALAAGYFLYDLIISSIYINVFGIGMLLHAISAVWVFSFGFVSFHFLGKPGLNSPFIDLYLLEAVSQLLCSEFHPLRALESVPQHPLVPR